MKTRVRSPATAARFMKGIPFPGWNGGRVLEGLLRPPRVRFCKRGRFEEAARSEEAVRFTRFMAGWTRTRMSVRANARRRGCGGSPGASEGHWPVPHRAHVFRERTHSPHARDDFAKTAAEREKVVHVVAVATGGFSGPVPHHGWIRHHPPADPPLHEFLPHEPEQVAELARSQVDRRRSTLALNPCAR